jgi:hypothetical protein
MNDEKLISEMARVWVDGGGDADGVLWCANRLHVAVLNEVRDRAEKDAARVALNEQIAAWEAELDKRAQECW